MPSHSEISNESSAEDAYSKLMRDLSQGLASAGYITLSDDPDEIRQRALAILRKWCRDELAYRARVLAKDDKRADALRMIARFAHAAGCPPEEVEEYLTEAQQIVAISHVTRRRILRTRSEVLGSPLRKN